jgi:GTP-binding protein
VSDAEAVLAKVSDRLQTSFPQVRGVPVVTLSALTGQGVGRLLPEVTKVYELWNTRVGTGRLNRWLSGVEQQHPPPLAKGRRVRLRYMTQAKARPPTFIVFASQPDGLPESYRRYLINDLRATFKLDGIPLRLVLRKGENPFAPGKRRN